MKEKTLQEIMERFRAVIIEEPFDLIVAVANGGIIPAALLNQRLHLEIQLLKIAFRGADHMPLYDIPRLTEEVRFRVKDRSVLLVEDRVRTGATLRLAYKLLSEAGARKVRTFAVNGKADYALFDEECFRMPWVL